MKSCNEFNLVLDVFLLPFSSLFFSHSFNLDWKQSLRIRMFTNSVEWMRAHKCITVVPKMNVSRIQLSVWKTDILCFEFYITTSKWTTDCVSFFFSNIKYGRSQNEFLWVNSFSKLINIAGNVFTESQAAIQNTVSIRIRKFQID